MYYVIVCPDKYCRGVSIVKDKHETVQCRSCDSQYKFRDYKQSYKTQDKDMAVKARTKLLVKINDSNLDIEEIEKKGYLKDAEKIFSNSSEKDTRKPKKIIRDQFGNIDEPKKNQIVNMAAENSKLDKEKAEKILEKMIRKGIVLKIGDEIELL